MAGSAWQSRQGRRVHRLRVGGQVLVIALEHPPGRRELVQQAWLADRVVGVAGLRRVEAVWRLGPGTAIISVVVVDAEGAAADHRDVVALALMHHAVVVRRRAIRGGITVDVRCKALPDDLRRRLVLLDDRDDVVVARDRAVGHRRVVHDRRCSQGGMCQDQGRCDTGKQGGAEGRWFAHHGSCFRAVAATGRWERKPR